MEKKVVTTNKKALHNFEILETCEAGLVLEGYEVKSLRFGKASLIDGLIRFDRDEAFLENAHIPPYTQQSSHVQDYNPKRKRKILLHKNEIQRLSGRVREKGLTVVPLEMYFSNKNIAKVTIGLAKGKNVINKRDLLRRRDIDRELEREIKG